MRSLLPWLGVCTFAGGCHVYDATLVNGDARADGALDVAVEASAPDAQIDGDSGRVDVMADTTADVALADVTMLDVSGSDIADVASADADAAMTGCALPMIMCRSDCVDPRTDIVNCGGCGMRCPVPMNGAALCRAASCDVRCNPGFEQVGSVCAAVGAEVCSTSLGATAVGVGQTLIRTGSSALSTGAPAFSCGSPMGGNATYAFDMPSAGPARFELFTETFDAVLEARTASCTGTATCVNAVARQGQETAVSPTTPRVYASLRGVARGGGAYALAVTPTASCGNRALDAGETCDDGDLTRDDGCQPDCMQAVPPVDRCASAAPAGTTVLSLSAGRQLYTGTIPMTATNDTRLGCASSDGIDGVYYLRPTLDGTLSVSLSNMQGSVGLFRNRLVGCDSASMLACGNVGSGRLTVTSPVLADETYALVVDNTSGAFTLTLEMQRCGNGSIETGESCDDGNVVAGDGCDAACAIEARCRLALPLNNAASPTAIPATCTSAVLTGMNTASGTANYFARITLAEGQQIDTTSSYTTSLSSTAGSELWPPGQGGSAGTTCSTNSVACDIMNGRRSGGLRWVSPAGGLYLLRMSQSGVLLGTTSFTTTVRIH